MPVLDHKNISYSERLFGADFRIKKYLHLLRILLPALINLMPSTGMKAQTPIDPYHFKDHYLEHLVKVRIDSVRRKYNCSPLPNDSILYLASKFHSRYMSKTGDFSHTEKDRKKTETPQLRAEYFGAVNYGAGENIIMVPYNSFVSRKNGETVPIFTYEAWADEAVLGWVNSKGHFANIINCKYQVTGLSLELNPVNKMIYCCQNFAIIHGKTDFKESSIMFPASDKVPPQTVPGGIPAPVLPKRKKDLYPFGLKEGDSRRCDACTSLLAAQPLSSVYMDAANNIILRIENAEFARRLLNSPGDGFAVEIVEYNDYMCENPVYYSKPSRRNGLSLLNGNLTEPLFKKDLEAGFKQREAKTEVRFLDYIFKSDSVSFFNRFQEYRADNYSNYYFEISLGKLPRDVYNYIEMNLVYIQNKRICYIQPLKGLCGEIFKTFLDTDPVFLPAEGTYSFEPERRKIELKLPFKKNDYNFSETDVSGFVKELEGMKYYIDSVSLQAYASVEGDSIRNAELQHKRADAIGKLLGKGQKSGFPVRVKTRTDWAHFYKNLAAKQQWKALSKKSHKELQDWFLQNGTEQFEAVLAQERRGEIRVYCSIECNEKNLKACAKAEEKRLCELIAGKLKKKEAVTADLKQFRKLYSFLHRAVREKKMTAKELASVEMPEKYRDNLTLVLQYLFYGLEYDSAFRENKHWMASQAEDKKLLYARCGNQKIHQLDFLRARETVYHYKTNKAKNLKEFQEIIRLLKNLETVYEKDSLSREQIVRMNVNANYVLLNDLLSEESRKYNREAMKSIAQLHRYYETHDSLTVPRMLALAKMAIYFYNVPYAIEIISPLLDLNDTIRDMYMHLRYAHPGTPGDLESYELLFELSKKMATGMWCDMFMKDCGVSFQLFDHDPLRKLFCQKCMEENDSVLKMKDSGIQGQLK